MTLLRKRSAPSGRLVDDVTNVVNLREGGQQAIPGHVAIIMDGNGRWAQARSMPRTAGHRKGAEAARRAVEGAIRLGIRYLTLYGFSSENWKRPSGEIADLMGLLRHYLKSEVAQLRDNGVRLRVIGDRSRFAPDIVGAIGDAERDTAENDRLTLIIALSYGGRAEIANAARRLAAAAKAGELDVADINEDTVGGHLYTAGIPDPDLLIRTSGEQRISNFLIWQLAYTEFIFLPTLWPDFTEQDFEEALRMFRARERRYGKV